MFNFSIFWKIQFFKSYHFWSNYTIYMTHTSIHHLQSITNTKTPKRIPVFQQSFNHPIKRRWSSVPYHLRFKISPRTIKRRRTWSARPLGSSFSLRLCGLSRHAANRIKIKGVDIIGAVPRRCQVKTSGPGRKPWIAWKESVAQLWARRISRCVPGKHGRPYTHTHAQLSLLPAGPPFLFSFLSAAHRITRWVK